MPQSQFDMLMEEIHGLRDRLDTVSDKIDNKIDKLEVRVRCNESLLVGIRIKVAAAVTVAVLVVQGIIAFLTKRMM